VTTTNVAPKQASGWPDWAARSSQDSTGN
jgi:hypothetical protein